MGICFQALLESNLERLLNLLMTECPNYRNQDFLYGESSTFGGFKDMVAV